VIGLRAVTKRYGDRVVLDALDLTLDDGAVIALLGANGSGKTTVGRLLLGLVAPDAGAVEGVVGLRRAAQFQENRLCEQLSAVGNVRLVLGRAAPVAEVVTALRAVGLDDESVAKPVHALSGGQRRRVALVRALLPEADLVVLDEPFTGVDTSAKALSLAWAAQRLVGRTALLITHDEAEAAALGARVVRLAGREDAGRPAAECDGGSSDLDPPG